MNIDGLEWGLDKEWEFADGYLSFLKVQSDPFALPSVVSYFLPQEKAGFPKELITSGDVKTAVEDFICRRMADMMHHCMLYMLGCYFQE